MTLPEVLITVTVMGIITTALVSAIIVTFRQADSTEGRVNVARAEQSIDTWLPADLASTDVTRTDINSVDTNPAASPCGNCAGIDMSGANALQLAWNTTVAGTPPVDVVTRVQYQYIQVGDEWQLQRIECIGGNQCTKNVVLHDLEPPADPATFDPNNDAPVWVMSVTVPDNPADLELSDNARRVSVTINGGGGSEGRGGGENTINLTAGGVETDDIDADEFTVPSFVRAKSRCGGPVTLVIDDSGSIEQHNVDNVVRPGVRAFIEAFRGTPTQIQIIQFSGEATALGPVTTDPSGWHRYVDMTNDTQVDQLKSSLSALTANGGTNWEDGFFHALRNSDGTAASVQPNRIVFFTDGIPTRNRTSRNRNWESSYSNGDKYIHFNAGSYNSSRWGTDNGTDFNQESFDRAKVILDQSSAERIMVGVGPGLFGNNSWVQNQAVFANTNAWPSSSQSKKGWEIVGNLLMGGFGGWVKAEYDSGAKEYKDPEANLYVESTFNTDAFAAAMQAAALKDCGGTLTLQTRLGDGSPVPTEFVFENRAYRDDAGNPIAEDPRTVTTSKAFRTGTFDFEIPAGIGHYSVDIVPQALQTLSGYTPAGWSCRSGANAKTTTPIAIVGSTWEGFTVDVKANEAVSCILTVNQS